MIFFYLFFFLILPGFNVRIYRVSENRIKLRQQTEWNKNFFIMLFKVSLKCLHVNQWCKSLTCSKTQIHCVHTKQGDTQRRICSSSPSQKGKKYAPNAIHTNLRKLVLQPFIRATRVWESTGKIISKNDLQLNLFRLDFSIQYISF